jgi:small subunit ribosomal protein S4
MKLFLKGERCYMAKCPVETGRPPPGGMGQRRRKTSDYGAQLREKQRLRRMYGMREKQFRTFFSRAAMKKGVTGEQLLQMLEMRLDNLVYRFGFAASRAAARQFIRHGHIEVDGKRASVPSMILKAGQVVQVCDKEKSRNMAKQSMENAESRGVSAWLTLDTKNYRGEIQQIPSRDDIALPINEQLVVELYSK